MGIVGAVSIHSYTPYFPTCSQSARSPKQKASAQTDILTARLLRSTFATTLYWHLQTQRQDLTHPSPKYRKHIYAHNHLHAQILKAIRLPIVQSNRNKCIHSQPTIHYSFLFSKLSYPLRSTTPREVLNRGPLLLVCLPVCLLAQSRHLPSLPLFPLLFSQVFFPLPLKASLSLPLQHLQRPPRRASFSLYLLQT